MSQMEVIYLVIAALLLLSILASKISSKIGVPTLSLFLIIGMLAGSEGIGGIEFNDPLVAQNVGTLALMFILFSGGLDTKLAYFRAVMWSSFSLSTLGVVFSTIIVGIFAHFIFNFGWLESFLFGAIVSPTDSAAVFATLRGRRNLLTQPLQSLIEVESGSNDPMAILLTVGLIDLITMPEISGFNLVTHFIIQVSFGLTVGFFMGKLIPFCINRLNLEYQGLYPVLTIAFVLLTYALSSLTGGNGFLAAYIAGLVMGQADFAHKRELMHFHEGITWLMQIIMFLVLGLLVFPSQLITELPTDLMMALVLMLIARPSSVFASLALAKIDAKAKLMISWVGLRGAVPIILATFPFIANLPSAHTIFDSVFFIVFISIIIQASLTPWMAKWLKVSRTEQDKS